MDTFQIARTDDTVQVTMNTNGMDADAIVEMLRRIQVEYLAQKVDFDKAILELGNEINRDWWEKNKTRLLGKNDEKIDAPELKEILAQSLLSKARKEAGEMWMEKNYSENKVRKWVSGE